ncbi:MAG: DNA primase [Candidatus Zixiibacteriota bacterium]|nr:MAG: DNA primase [candidate division Zixibacteria bacterium]
MGRIPEDIVQRIKNESDIISVVSEFVNLRKSGKDFKGLCPFHQEKTPSFFVIPAKQFYHCFGCGKGGNVINFIMDHERLEYPDALRFLAQKAGIEIPRTDSGSSDIERVYEALSFAERFFNNRLLASDDGRPARDYLKSRGINEDIIKRFGLGFAPDSWDGLLKAASGEKIQTVALERAGLVKRKQGLYDRFRKRIMVPIKNISGKNVAFGGRIMPGDEGAKYINSPETDVYKKSRILYGLDISKNSMREKNEAVVVEGYFDLISLFQAGITNVVAASGTGFASEQASLLSRFCGRVVLMYDPDSAGIKAAFRACGVLYNAGLEPRLIRLPKGTDPDGYIRKHGAENLSKVISEADDIFDFVIKGLKGKISDQTVAVQKKIIGKIVELIEPIGDRQTRAIIYEKIYSRLGVDIKPFAPGEEKRRVASAGRLDDVNVNKDNFENTFLSIIISHPELYGECLDKVDGSLFSESDNAKIFEIIGTIQSSGREISVSNLFDEIGSNGLRDRLSKIAFIEHSLADWATVFDDCMRRFKKIAIKRRLDELKSLIDKAGKESDRDRLEILTREFHKLKAEV